MTMRKCFKNLESTNDYEKMFRKAQYITVHFKFII